MTATAPHRATTLPNRFTHSLQSFVHPSRDACSWPPRCSGTLASARQGGGRERAPSRDPGKGWQTTSLRSHSLQPTHPVSGHTNPTHPKATRGRAGKRLAFGLTLCNTLTQPAGTPTPNIQRGTVGKRLAFGLTLCNPLTQPAGTPTPNIQRGKAGKRLASGLTLCNPLTLGVRSRPTKSHSIQSLWPLRRIIPAIGTQTITTPHSASVTKHDPATSRQR